MSKTVTLELFTFEEALPDVGEEVLLVQHGIDWYHALYQMDNNGVGFFELENDDEERVSVSEDPAGRVYLWCHYPTTLNKDLQDDFNSRSQDDSPESNNIDPVIAAIESRANELSISSLNPEAIARKLREELSQVAGQAAITYHIGGRYDSKTGEAKFTIARLSPDLAIRLSTNLLASDLSIAYTKQTSSGWNIEVGLIAKHYGAKKASEFINGLSGSHVEAEFSVTIRKQ